MEGERQVELLELAGEVGVELLAGGVERAVAARSVVPQIEAGQAAVGVGVELDVADRAGVKGGVHVPTTSRTGRM